MKRRHNHESRWTQDRQGWHTPGGPSRRPVSEEEATRIYEKPYLLRQGLHDHRVGAGSSSPR